MARIDEHPHNRIGRLKQALDRLLPRWLYEQVTFHPNRAGKPTNYPVAIGSCVLAVIVAIVALILSSL